MISKLLFRLTIATACLCSAAAFAAEAVPSADESAPSNGLPAPTHANIPYGDHERQVLDFWQAKSDKPTPVVFFLHGGGWVKGEKQDIRKRHFEQCLVAGISIVSVNYRYSWQADAAGVKPPVEWPMSDARRALQFIRSKAGEWNLDPIRIGATGGSAGACSSLWLAFHDDLADPKSSDPVARQSTRLYCVATDGAQTSLDPSQMHDWTPNSRYGGHAFGVTADARNEKLRDAQFSQFLERREEFLPWIKQYSPIEHATADDPPVYLWYKAPPALGKPDKDPTHTANFGVKLKEKLAALGVPCELVYPGAPDVKHPTIEAFLIDALKSSP